MGVIKDYFSIQSFISSSVSEFDLILDVSKKLENNILEIRTIPQSKLCLILQQIQEIKYKGYKATVIDEYLEDCQLLIKTLENFIIIKNHDSVKIIRFS